MLSEVFLPKKKHKNFTKNGLMDSNFHQSFPNFYGLTLCIFTIVAPVVRAKKNGTQPYAMFMSGIEPETSNFRGQVS